VEKLMDFCTQWGLSECHDDIRKYKVELEFGPEEGLRGDLIIPPVGVELKRLNDICKTCKHRLFEIVEPQCPACDSKKISKIASGGQAHRPDLGNVFTYECENCKSKLTSLLEFDNH